MSRRLNRRKVKQSPKTKGFTGFVLGAVLLAPTLTLVAPKDAHASWSAVWTYVKQNLLTTELNDAFKTAVTQDAVGSQVLAETLLIAKQKQISAETQLQKKENFLKMYEDYISPSSMTNNSRCEAVGQRTNEHQIPSRSKAFATLSIQHGLMGDAFGQEYQRQQALIDIRSGLSCTLEMASQGFCTPSVSGAQYFDVDFSMSNVADRLDQNQLLASKIAVDTIANTAQDSLQTAQCTEDSACTASRVADQNRTAVNSLVANSLINQLYDRMALGGDK